MAHIEHSPPATTGRRGVVLDVGHAASLRLGAKPRHLESSMAHIEHNTPATKGRPGIEHYLTYVNDKPLIKNIPRGSSLCIVSLPSRREVYAGRVNGSYTPADLDPGKYAFTVQKYPIFNNPGR